MKYSVVVAIFALLCGCKQSSGQRHTNYLHMRAMPTNDTLGCKDGRIWRQVGNDDFVDIGPITDSCNCNPKEEYHNRSSQKIPILPGYIACWSNINPDSFMVTYKRVCANGEVLELLNHPFVFVKRDKGYDTLRCVVYIISENKKDTTIQYSTSRNLFDATDYSEWRVFSTGGSYFVGQVDTAYIYEPKIKR